MIKNIIEELSHRFKLPKHVIYKHIVPYTYRTQSEGLQIDIINYKQDINLLDSRYFTHYNGFILLVDILNFNGFSVITMTLNEKLEEVLRQHITLRNYSKIKLLNFVKKMLLVRDVRIERYIKLLWGLMDIKERNIFIERYILSDELE